MRSRLVHYELHDGFIDHWLVAGPQVVSVDSQQLQGEDFQHTVLQQFYMDESGITATPVERGPLDKGLFTIGSFNGSWEYYRCREDHSVDQSAVYPVWSYLRSWAYIEVESPAIQEVVLEMSVFGAADVWVNREHALRLERDGAASSAGQTPTSAVVKVMMTKGRNPILVRFETVGVRACPHGITLRVSAAGTHSPEELTAGTCIGFPSLIPSLARRHIFEEISQTVYLTRDVYSDILPIEACWPAENSTNSYTDIRFQTPAGQIYAQAEVDGNPGDKVFLGYVTAMAPGAYQAFLMPRAWEYYEKNIRITCQIPCWSIGAQAYAQSPYGDYSERRIEALTAAARLEGSIFSEIARMALGWWSLVNVAVIHAAIDNVSQRQAGSNLLLLGLLGMLNRFGETAAFPQALQAPLKACILGYHYSQAEPGVDGLDFLSETDRIVFATCEILAGQSFPAETFSASGQSGNWHKQRAEKRVVDWLNDHAAWGFEDWGAPATLETSLAALFHLIDLAESESIWGLAAVVIDKLLFHLALHSYKGNYIHPHRGASAAAIKNGMLSPTAGISRLLWGMGTFGNLHTAGTVSLACADQYELPLIFSQIANDLPAELWTQEQQAAPSNPGWRANLAAYKTADYLLCSAQDYHPGERGEREHPWQATLGAEVAVFVSQPGGSSENEARWPNFWAGNAHLPRVAQWKDALIAIHRLPESDPLGFTHAFFPVLTFDEYVLRGGWAFARKGDGYLALTNSQGFELIRQGLYAYRELRAVGPEQVWLCQMGRAAQDGDFAAFQEKVLALPVAFEGLAVRFTSLRGDTLALGWEGPFLRNGTNQALAGFKHIDTFYTQAELPCKEMIIQRGEEGLRIDFQIGPAGQDVS